MRFLILFLVVFIAFTSNAQRPNVLWITIEDTSPHFIGCYGNKDARTPVIDQLAKAGVTFTNAFSTGTVCSPSRSTLITGVRTFEMGTGNHRSQFPIPDFIKGFPYYLRQQGYYVTNNRKTDYNIANEKQFIAETWDESSGEAGWWNRKPGQPFFAVMNFEDSHQSRTMTQPYKWYEAEVLANLEEHERIHQDSFSMPPFYRDSPEMRKQLARVYNSVTLTDKKIGGLLDRLKRDHLMDSTIVFFFADHGEGIPRGKTNGINLGHRVPFVIWFPPMYEHLSPWRLGSPTTELITFEDLAPTIIGLAGGDSPPHLKGRMLIGDTRGKAPAHVILSSDRSDNGMDMVRSITDGRYFYARNYMPFLPEARYIRYMEIGKIKQIQRKDLADGNLSEMQRKMFAPRPAEFLFDIAEDPWELKDLAKTPGMQTLLEEMRLQLKQKVMASRDVMFLPEYEIDLIAQDTTPYEYRLDPDVFPIEQIYQAASLSGHRGESAARQQVNFLQDSNKIVRYWAITGLRSQKEDVLQKFQTQLRSAMSDSYPPVAITASAITYELFGDAVAEENLKKYCRDPNSLLALLALNFILYLEDPSPFVETAVSIKNKTDVPYYVSGAAKDLLGRMGLIGNNWENR